MNELYEELEQLVDVGYDFNVDLKNHTLVVAGRPIVKRGKVLTEEPLCGTITQQDIEDAYAVYRHSIPSKRRAKEWFRALKYEDLSKEDKQNGGSRLLAQFRLEYMVLAAILTKQMNWCKCDTYFWRSEKHPSLTILKHWIIND